MKQETKVGFIVIAGIIVLMVGISFLGAFRFTSDGYKLEIIFKRVGGLSAGNSIQFVGVPVGKVEKVEVFGNSVKVTVSIKDEVKIPKGSTFLLGSSGVMGSAYIDIEPPQSVNEGYLEPGSTINGFQGVGMDDVLGSAKEAFTKLNTMADTVNILLGDEDIQKSLKQTIVNTQDITGNINELTKIFTNIAVENQSELNQMVGQLSGMASHMNNVASRMDRMLLEVDNNGQTSQDLVNSLYNLKQASENIEKITKSIEGLTGDENVQEDIKQTLKNAREASDKANKMLGGFGKGFVNTSFDFKYGDKPNKFRTDANIEVNYAPKQFFVLGVAGIGEENDLNLQLGKKLNDVLGMRAGIFLGDVGAGLDVNVSKWLKLSTDVYDPNKVKVKVAGEFRLNDRFSIVAETLNVRKKLSDSTYIGVRGYF